MPKIWFDSKSRVILLVVNPIYAIKDSNELTTIQINNKRLDVICRILFLIHRPILVANRKDKIKNCNKSYLQFKIEE